MFNHKLIVLTLATIVILVVLPIEIKPITADDTWNDALLFCPFTTTVQENIRNITNTASFPLNVTVSYLNAENISLIKLYQLSANGTTFIKIMDGAVVNNSNAYWPLYSEETLIFTVYARPNDTILQNETASVKVKIQAVSIETQGGIWRPFVATEEIECTLDTAPYVQSSLAQLIANRLPIHYVINIKNKYSFPLNITIRSWMSAFWDYHIVCYSTNSSLFVAPNSSVTRAFDFLLPVAGFPFQNPYVLHIAFDYEINKKPVISKDLLATINIDSSHAIIQVIVIVGSVVALVFILYFGLFKGRKKEGKDATEILTFQ